VEHLLRHRVGQGPTPRLTTKLNNRKTARDGRARNWEPRRHGSTRGRTARRRPNRCAAHPEPFSCVDVDVWRGGVL
jgi:hypothetical protein